MSVRSDEDRRRLKARLARVEGQVRGVQRMLDEDRDCREVVQQLAAVRAAVHHAGLEVMRVYAAQCLASPAAGQPTVSSDEREALVDYLIDTLGRHA